MRQSAHRGNSPRPPLEERGGDCIMAFPIEERGGDAPPLKVRVGLGLVFVVCCLLFLACQPAVPANVDYYTCPMHPQIHAETKGQCPICGMDLVPVMKNSGAEKSLDHSGHSQNSGGEVVSIDPSYTQRTGVVTESVQERDLTQEIVTYGKVAHDKDLWVAQNEFIEAIKLGDGALIRAAELKLKFLGLSDEWISELKKSRKADLSFHLHVQEHEQRVSYIEAYVYQDDFPRVKQGLRADILDQKGHLLSPGHVRAIGTMVDLNSRSVRVLVEADQSLNLRLNTFVQVSLKIPVGKKLSVSRESVLFNGDHNMVYLDLGGGKFAPRQITLGDQGGEFYEVTSGLKTGDTVVSNGHFLIDSETRIRTGVNEHQHGESDENQ